MGIAKKGVTASTRISGLVMLAPKAITDTAAVDPDAVGCSACVETDGADPVKCGVGAAKYWSRVTNSQQRNRFKGAVEFDAFDSFLNSRTPRRVYGIPQGVLFGSIPI